MGEEPSARKVAPDARWGAEIQPLAKHQGQYLAMGPLHPPCTPCKGFLDLPGDKVWNEGGQARNDRSIGRGGCSIPPPQWPVLVVKHETFCWRAQVGPPDTTGNSLEPASESLPFLGHTELEGRSLWGEFLMPAQRHLRDLRLARERFLSRGTTRWLGTWVADLTMRSMISSAASSVTLGESSVPIVHELVDPEALNNQRVQRAQQGQHQRKYPALLPQQQSAVSNESEQ